MGKINKTSPPQTKTRKQHPPISPPDSTQTPRMQRVEMLHIWPYQMDTWIPGRWLQRCVRIRSEKTSGFCWLWPIKGRMEKPPIFFFSFNRRFLPSKTWERFDWRNSTNWLTQGVHLIRCFWGQGGGSIYSKCFWNLGDHWHGWDRSSTRMVRYKSYLFRRDDLPNTFPFPYRNGFSLVFFLGGGTLWGHQLVSKHKQPW